MKRALLTGQTLLMITIALSGCFTTRINFAQHPQHEHAVPSALHDTWHHNAVFGLVEVSSPIRLQQVCPEGKVAYVTQKTGVVAGLVAHVTALWYTPQEVTVMCQAP